MPKLCLSEDLCATPDRQLSLEKPPDQQLRLAEAYVFADSDAPGGRTGICHGLGGSQHEHIRHALLRIQRCSTLSTKALRAVKLSGSILTYHTKSDAQHCERIPASAIALVAASMSTSDMRSCIFSAAAPPPK